MVNDPLYGAVAVAMKLAVSNLDGQRQEDCHSDNKMYRQHDRYERGALRQKQLLFTDGLC